MTTNDNNSDKTNTINDTKTDQTTTTSKTSGEYGFLNASASAVEKIADVAAKKGLKTVSLATGVVIILAMAGEFLTTKTDYVPHHGEIISLIIGGLLIIIPILLNELDYKWEIYANLRKRELLNERTKIEADYHIACFKEMQLDSKTPEKPDPNPVPPK